MKTYTGLYIFAGSAKDEVLDQLIEKACGEITRVNGNVLSKEILGKKTFAHLMHKRDCGVYVRIRFEAEPAAITTLTNRYHLMEEVFRVQFTVVDLRREEKIAKQAEERAAREAARAAREAEKAAAAENAPAAEGTEA
ncbi:MAG: 30S ribosomal protein S6 [Kiritimatiellae bacterium]|nr:30S ribosomal protein S6 [Kiritimatiellia bacterium]